MAFSPKRLGPTFPGLVGARATTQVHTVRSARKAQFNRPPPAGAALKLP